METMFLEIYQVGSMTGRVWLGNKTFTVYRRVNGSLYVIYGGKRRTVTGACIYI